MATRTPTTKPGGRRPRKAAARLKAPAATPPAASKLDALTALLARHDGASIAELTAASGWQPHSVRGALAGALKRRGLSITSDKIDGVRRYRSKRAR